EPTNVTLGGACAYSADCADNKNKNGTTICKLNSYGIHTCQFSKCDYGFTLSSNKLDCTESTNVKI
ncbi:hypothetical protein HDU99_009531, partial [Rhizoclosmatium hyalinum]